MKERKYITTPIYYVNGNPHVGHAHTSIMGDILKREYELRSCDVYYTTGVDEHGQKNQSAIETSGLSAQDYLDRQSKIFNDLFDLLNVKYDKFVRTTSEEHKKAVQHVLNLVYQKGLIVNKEYEGLYCVGCEMFKTQNDLDENGFCVDHQTKPIMMKESNYFFTLSAYQDWLIDYINKHPEWIQPEHYRNEILHLLDEPLPDLCISRTKARCWHGIELPFDKDYVAYVWFDALINYISSLGYPDTEPPFADYWNTCTHLMAKDIIKTHCIYWPIMLKAIGLEPQYNNYVHGYWTGEGGIKMSKTIGNVIDPYKVVEMFGVDPFRYFLARVMGDNESSMSYQIVKNCYNFELTNNISNALYRTMKLAYKQFKGIYPDVISFRAEDEAFLESVKEEVAIIISKSPSLSHINERAGKLYEMGKMVNLYFDKCAPWILVKEENQDNFNSCIMTCIEALRLIMEVAYPIMPRTSDRVLKSLGIEAEWRKNYEVKAHALKLGTQFEEPFILFQRLE